MADIDQLFAGMATAPVFGRGNYMSGGVYDVEIVKMSTKKTFKGADVLICEFKILKSSNPDHAVGSTGSWVPKFAQPNTFGNIKELIFAIFGEVGKDVPPSETAKHALTAAVARAACGSDTAKAELAALKDDKGNPTPLNVDDVVVGAQVRLECEQITTRANQPFTRYSWSPLPDEPAAAS